MLGRRCPRRGRGADRQYEIIRELGRGGRACRSRSSRKDGRKLPPAQARYVKGWLRRLRCESPVTLAW